MATARIAGRTDTAAAWTAANPTLAAGEWGHETDTGRSKLGDGTTAWTVLGYWVDLIAASIPAHYARDIRWRAKSMSARTTLASPGRMTVNIDGQGYALPAAVDIDLSSSGSWDTTSPTNYTVAANRAGKDFYIYACVPAGGTVPDLVISANATFPSGYSAATSRKIGGFHCLCATVGTSVYAYVNEAKDPEYLAEAYETVSVSAGDTRHWLRDYVAGDLLPFSIWDLLHRPAVSDPEGTVYHPGVNRWIDIYLASWDAGARKLRSVFGAAFVTGATTVKFHPARFDQVFALQGQQMPSKQEFVAYSIGGPQGVNIAGAANPGTTGGHSATNGLRITSNIGCEDATGVLWQWGRDHSGNSRSSWANAFDANDSNVAGQDISDPTRPLFGGRWSVGAQCGSRGASWLNASLALASISGSRGVAEPCTGRA